ncbi:MAG: isoprenylcysteine carboxylmethyltransferase family protein [Candidatus Aminicenantes bacterium]|nr:MAG: isoprenylcysteine carboxylmethyltransferase family protein [Candidatus Aminicenantes bacterium]
MPKQGLLRIIYKWRVRVSLLFVALAVVLAEPKLLSILIGVGLTFIGLILRTWACGHLEKEKKLTTSGPYRYSRNPLYFGNLLIGLGVVIGAQSWWVMGCAFMVFVIFYPVIILSEKQKMEELFPLEYPEYKKLVPLFFPSYFTTWPHQNTRFRWALHKKNREYRAIIGSTLFWIIITAKLLFF